MTSLDLVFILVAVVTGGAAVLTVTSRNLIHAALFLAVALAGLGGVFLLLAADFVAMVQVVVYLGAITVLFLFGLMLTRAPIGREALDSRNRPMALVVSAALFGILVVLIVRAFSSFDSVEPVSSGIADIGLAIFSTWVFPFEVLSMMLLAALVGAVLLARRQSGDSGQHTQVTPIREALDESADQPELERAPAELGTGGER